MHARNGEHMHSASFGISIQNFGTQIGPVTHNECGCQCSCFHIRDMFFESCYNF